MGDTIFDTSNKPLSINNNSALRVGEAGSAAVCNGGFIQYAMADQNGTLTVLSTSVEAYHESGDFSSLNNWNVVFSASSIPRSMAPNFSINGAVSIIAIDNHNFIFWRDNSNNFWAMRCKLTGSSNPKVAPIDLSETTLDSAKPSTNIAAVYLPKETGSNLAGKIGLVGMVPDENFSFLLAIVVDPDKFEKNEPWIAEDYSGGLWNKLEVDHGDMARTYTTVTAGWLNQGVLQLSASDTLKPYFNLVVIYTDPQSPNSTKSYGLPLADAFDFSVRNGPSRVTPTTVSWELGIQVATVPSIRIAPDGSMWAGCIDSDGYIRAAQLQPNTESSDDVNYGKPGLYNPAWALQHNDLDGSLPSIKGINSICSVYIPLPQTMGQSPFPIPVPGNPESSAKIYSDCILEKYIECNFSGGYGNPVPCLSTFYWGEVFSVQNYMTTTLRTEHEDTLLLSLVADAFPYPVPMKEVWGSDSPSGMINWQLCTYQYLIGDSIENSTETRISGAVGFKFSETLLVTSVGVQTEDSLSIGYSSITKKSHLTHNTTSYAINTKGLPLELTDLDEDREEANLQISQQGALFGTAAVNKVAFDLCATALRGQTSLQGSIAYNVHPLIESPPTTISSDFRTYCYTPGNPLTYTESAINQRMKSLFDSLTEDQQRMFIINGEDLRWLYDDNYMTNIVKRFGVKSLGPGRNSSFLEFSASETGIQRNEFQDTTGFTDTGGWYMNGSFYAGVASHLDAEFEVGILGIIGLGVDAAEETTSFLVGVDFNASIEKTEETAQTWGTSLEEYLNPLAPREAYTVNMYLLKPSPLWATELNLFGFPATDYPPPGPDIDLTNSSPVRVIFTVPYISDTLADRLRSLPN